MPKEETIELIKLNKAWIAKSGVSTANGDAGAITLIDTIGVTEADDYWKNMTLVLIDGTNQGLARRIIHSYQATGTLEVYPRYPYFVALGVSYKIMANIVASGDTSPTVDTGSYNHPNDTTENTVATLSAPSGARDITHRFDMSNITQNLTIRQYEQIDGTNYRQITAKIFPTDFDPGTKGVETSFKMSEGNYRITFQSAVAEGSIKAIPYTSRFEEKY